MSAGKIYTPEEATEIGNRIGVDWQEVNLDEFCMGLSIELEHGRQDQFTNVTDDNEILTA